MKLKLNAPLYGLAAGSVVEVQTAADGHPVDRRWRDRLRDARIDNCVEIVQSKTKAKKAPDADAGPVDEGVTEE